MGAVIPPFGLISNVSSVPCFPLSGPGNREGRPYTKDASAELNVATVVVRSYGIQVGGEYYGLPITEMKSAEAKSSKAARKAFYRFFLWFVINNVGNAPYPDHVMHLVR